MSVSIDPERAEMEVIHRLIDFSGRTVLEVGCGDGRLTWRYADQADRVLAIDPDPDEVEIAQENLPDSLRQTVEFRVADITTEWMPRGDFDLAILSYSLWWIEPEGVVDALRNIHESLQPEGLLLDIHPVPEHAAVEIWQRDRIHEIGRLDESQDVEEILHAEAQLAELVGQGWFVQERLERFEMLRHFPTLEDWMEQRARKSSTSIIPDQVLHSARRLLAEIDAELVLRQHAQIALFRRSHPARWPRPTSIG